MGYQIANRCTSAALLLTMVSGCSGTRPAVPDPVTGDGVDALSWLSGTWIRHTDGSTSEEHWTAPAGGTMFGINRSVRNGKTVFYEYLRIVENDGGLVYYAAPRGGDETAFRMTSGSANIVRFENTAHDFPQSIGYRRDGETLHATIGGVVDGEYRERSWQWKRR